MRASRVSYLSDDRQIADAVNKALRRTDGLDLSADQSTITTSKPLNVSTAIQVNGVQVVGPQQAAIANTSGATLAALETEVNKLKAALRTAGMIAP